MWSWEVTGIQVSEEYREELSEEVADFFDEEAQKSVYRLRYELDSAKEHVIGRLNDLEDE